MLFRKNDPSSPPPPPKTKSREWVDSLLFAVIAATLIRWATFEAHRMSVAAMMANSKESTHSRDLLLGGGGGAVGSFLRKSMKLEASRNWPVNYSGKETTALANARRTGNASTRRRAA